MFTKLFSYFTRLFRKKSDDNFDAYFTILEQKSGEIIKKYISKNDAL